MGINDVSLKVEAEPNGMRESRKQTHPRQSTDFTPCPASAAPDFTTCKKHPMGKTALSVSGLQWMPDMQTLTQNGPKTYMEDRNPLDYCKKTQQKCFRTLEWAYISVFVQVSPKTQTGKLKIGKSDFT